MESNEVLEKLPSHLMSLVIDQPYHDYTARDHAIWRYVMRQNVKYLPKVAHSSYLEGLNRTGVSVEQIPHMYGMNRILRDIGWAAVAVDGFIPPAAFMEFQAYNVLVIAADIRPIDQIEYTPAPDIIHEAAGHAPIIANAAYAAYLRNFGIAGSKAFSSPYDSRLYEAIRHLSILKADPASPSREIENAEMYLHSLEEMSDGPSEMALLRNLHWWTVEYGLIGTPEKPKIYGAGLLSSIGESYNCMQPSVKKLPYSIDAKNYNFDITTQQPQLFVTPDFDHLNLVLAEYSSGMAWKKGGLEALRKAKGTESISTVLYSSGLQVTGCLAHITETNGFPVYLSFNGPVILCSENRLLAGHGKEYHQHGFGSPVGLFRGISTPPEMLSENDLEANGIIVGRKCAISFESGIEVNGILRNLTKQSGKILLMSFSDCTVTHQGRTLFRPEWGIYDMAVGSNILSAFSGAADPDAYGFEFPVPEEKTHKIQHTDHERQLFSMYTKVRQIRQGSLSAGPLPELAAEITNLYSDEWLLLLEILEILAKNNELPETRNLVLHQLTSLVKSFPGLSKVIHDGLELSE